MRIATWNVNSIKQRIENLVAWLKERQPDVVCLQETKCVDEAFPREPLEALGYNRRHSTVRRPSTGWRSCRNTASTRSRPACRATTSDDHARFIEAAISTEPGVAPRRLHLSAQRKPRR